MCFQLFVTEEQKAKSMDLSPSEAKKILAMDPIISGIPDGKKLKLGALP